VASIQDEIVIARPITEVFDFVADQRNEPKHNPSMVRAEKLAPGAIGKGTRFRATITSMGRPLDMLLEATDYERPTRLANTTSMSSAETRGALTFEPDIGGTRMRWSWDVKPKGAFKFFTPIIGRVGKRQESAIWASLRRYLESTPMVGQPDDNLWHR